MHRQLGTCKLLSVASVVSFGCLLTLAASAQTFSVLHNFTGTGDGGGISAGLTIDSQGNLYGTAEEGGGSCSCGTVFKLTLRGSSWTLAPLYTFQEGSDGSGPQAKVIMGPNGSLYGTTDAGGEGPCDFGAGCGTVFNLQPPAHAQGTALAPWTKTVLYRFTGGADGANPGQGTLVFDAAGNFYGTTQTGGADNLGVVYKLTRTNGGWTQSVIYSFTGAQDGSQPFSGVVFDNAGNLYGTTTAGGNEGFGTVYQLKPVGSGWTETTLHTFSGGHDGIFPWGGLVFDGSETFYGMTTNGGDGVAYKLTSVSNSFIRSEGAEPIDSPILDAGGNLYGTALNGGTNNIGAVFELTRSGGVDFPFTARFQQHRRKFPVRQFDT
jgi:uncharacterized repeat protein (TIGR03803 family)